MARSDARRVRVGSVWKGAREPPDFLGSGGTTTASPAASTAAAGVVSGSPARRWRASCSGVLPFSNFSASAEVSQRPSLVMPIGTTSYLLLSIAPRTDAAERRETSCSPLRPPKRMPTRSFFMTLVWTRVSLASISRYDLSDLQKKKEYVMTVPFTMMNRREALATLGSGGLGLLAMHLSPVHTDSVKENTLDTALLKFSEKSRQRLLRLLKEPGFSGYIPSTEVKAVCDGGALWPLPAIYERAIARWRHSGIGRWQALGETFFAIA